MNSILAQYGLPYKYPKNVEDAANKISGEITEQDYKEREDFRKVFTCTIDPKDAKDFDDALSIQRLENGNWQVGVHIADVSHYVTEGSIIDKGSREACHFCLSRRSHHPDASRASLQLHLLTSS